VPQRIVDDDDDHVDLFYDDDDAGDDDHVDLFYDDDPCLAGLLDRCPDRFSRLRRDCCWYRIRNVQCRQWWPGAVLR